MDGKKTKMSAVLEIFRKAWEYALSHPAELTQALLDHIQLVAIAIGISILVCIPLGVWTSRPRGGGHQRAALAVMNSINGLRVIPSLAILFLVVPYLGLSKTSAAVALTVLALPPILINTDTAFRGIDPAVREAALGVGMTNRQMLWRVEFPLALPVILTGVRTATVDVIASATLAAFVGSGGLGIFVTRGFALYDYSILLVGAVPVALLTLIAEGLLGTLQVAVQRG